MRLGRTAAVIAIAAAVVSSCGEDEDDSPPNTLSIIEQDYAFEIDGEPEAGTLTIAVENAGEEIHEIAMFPLRDGMTVDDVRTALESPAEGDEDPLADIAAGEDSPIDDLGGVQFPNSGYSVTGSGIEAGDYAVVCFLPDAEGTSHASLGMVGGFTIGDGEAANVPEADATFTVTDGGLDGPDERDAGETVLRVANESSTPREITLLKLAEGQTPDDVVAFFEATGDGLPDVSASPFDYFAFVFDAEQDRTITVDLTPGQWGIAAPDPENPSEAAPDEDPFVVLFDVS